MELTEKLKHLEENIKVLREIKDTVTLDDFIAYGLQMQEHI